MITGSHPDCAWIDIDYPNGGVAQVAETRLAGQRLVVRRTRLVGVQATLWPDWRYHAFITDREGGAVTLDANHRRHAVSELAIHDLKDGVGLRHCPPGGTSWPTPPGPSSPRSPTTCFAGSPPLGSAAAGQWWPRPSAVACWPCLGG